MTMEYRSFVITARQYSPLGPRIWAALRPRAGNTTFGDIIVTACSAEALYRKVDRYVAEQGEILRPRIEGVQTPVCNPPCTMGQEAFGPACTNKGCNGEEAA